ncbi:MAG: hypothetical protein HZA24_02665 [Nitrospirae bacterium]|nr:hypothetical protein [Nitrospirota bacterium]
MTQVSRRAATVSVLALVAALLVALDLCFFAAGTYRAPVFDAALYLELANYLLVIVGGHVPGMAGWVAAMAPTVPVERAADLDGDVVVRYLAGKGLGYPAFLAGAQLLLGEGVERLRLAQALLHGLSAVLVFDIARRLAPPAVAFLALGLFALYLPATYMASQVLAESLCLFLILLAVLLAMILCRGAAGPRRAPWLAAALGLVLFWLGVSRPAYFPFSLLAVAGLALLVPWRLRARGGGAAALAGVLLMGAYLVPYLAWQAQVTRAHHAEAFLFSPSGQRSITPSLNESYDLANDGWVAPAAFVGPRGRNPYAPPALDSVREHPLDSALLRVEKFYRLWKGPAVTYVNPFILSGHVTAALHGLLVLGALVGLATVARGLPALLLAAPVVYTAAVYTGYFSEERRFAFPVMGLVAVLCALGLHWAWRAYVDAGLRAYGHRVGFRPGLWAALCVTAWMLAAGPGWVVQPWVDPGLTHLAAALLLGMLLAAGAVWLARHAGLDMGRRVWAGALLLGCGVLPVTVHLARDPGWHAWSLPLSRPGTLAVQTFLLPDGLTAEAIAVATLQLDVRDGDGRVDDLDVRLDGMPLTGPVSVAAMPGPLRFAAEQMTPLRQVDWRTVAVVPGMRQWLTYRLPPQLLAAGAAQVSVRARAPGADTRLYGDLAFGNPAVAAGPRPWIAPADLKRHARRLVHLGRDSLWRYQTEGDMRLYGGTPLSGRAQSGFVPGPGLPKQADDLSSAPLRQGGGYRIRLQLITVDGRELIL